MRKSNVIVMVHVQTRMTAAPGDLPTLLTAAGNPVSAAFGAVDAAFTSPPHSTATKDNFFPRPEPPNNCKPDIP